MDLLLGSTEGLADRRTFMTVQVLFWLLGAIDGHAKNFSIFLLPGGSFRLAPAYDVMSAYPLVARRQMERNSLRMAMALRGKNRHDEWSRIVYRHWLGTARACRFPAEEMEAIISGLAGRMEEVLAKVAGQLPASFSMEVAEPIFTGMRQARDGLLRSRE